VGEEGIDREKKGRWGDGEMGRKGKGMLKEAPRGQSRFKSKPLAGPSF
jgi:hypothetical protein